MRTTLAYALALGSALALGTCTAEVIASPTNAASGTSTQAGSRAAVGPGGPTTNSAPYANAGDDAAITINTAGAINCTTGDDGLPIGTVTCAWTKQSGAGGCTFGNAALCSTTVTCDTVGDKAIRCTASDSVLTAFDEFTAMINTAPSVNAGTDFGATEDVEFTLTSTVSDDGNPSTPGDLDCTLSKQSGSGSCTFEDIGQPGGAGHCDGSADDCDTVGITCDTVTTAVIRLSCTDGALTTNDDVSVTVAAAGACSAGSLWPGTTNVCPDDIEAQILSETGVTVVAPTPPTLPSGSVTTCSGTACDSDAEVATAMMGSGWRQITLGGNISAIDPHDAGVGAQDVTIYLNGFSIDGFFFGHQAGDAARIVFVGPGRIRTMTALGGSGRMDDVVFHGVKIGDTNSGQAQFDIGNGGLCSRWSFTSTVAVGTDSGGDGDCLSTFAQCTDLMVANSNWEGGESSGGAHDDWVLRWGFTAMRIWLINFRARGWYKPVLRGNGGEVVMYSTDDCAGTSCASLQANTYVANLMHAVSDGVNGIDIEQMLFIRGQFIMGDTSGIAGGTGLWGPETDTDRAWWGANQYCATNAGIFEEADLTGREGGQGGDDWDLNETYDSVSNTFDYESTVEDCFTNFGGWPMVDAPAIDTIDNSAIDDVEDDPHDIGP